jgi:hypothetical protein
MKIRAKLCFSSPLILTGFSVTYQPVTLHAKHWLFTKFKKHEYHILQIICSKYVAFLFSKFSPREYVFHSCITCAICLHGICNTHLYTAQSIQLTNDHKEKMLKFIWSCTFCKNNKFHGKRKKSMLNQNPI